MSSQKSFSEAVLGTSVGTLAIDREIRLDVCVNHFAKPNGAFAMIGTANVSGGGVTNSSTLRRTLNRHVLSGTIAKDLVVIGYSKVDDHFFLS